MIWWLRPRCHRSTGTKEPGSDVWRTAEYEATALRVSDRAIIRDPDPPIDMSVRHFLGLGLVVIAALVSAPLVAQQTDDLPAAPSAVAQQKATPAKRAQRQPPAGNQNQSAGARAKASTSPSSAPQTEQGKASQKKEGQTKRMLWVVPNFAAVSAGKQLPPLSRREKFVLATHDCLDYSGFTWSAILAAQSYALNSDPELGRGAAGYGRYYWRTFVDGVSGSYFTEAIVPSLTHEDPRYYTKGQGGFLRRTGYALSRVVLTKTDSGGTSFNWSEVAGNAAVAGLSNAYYPPQERGVHQTVRDWGAQIESAALNNIAKEFWPDIRHKLLRQK